MSLKKRSALTKFTTNVSKSMSFCKGGHWLCGSNSGKSPLCWQPFEAAGRHYAMNTTFVFSFLICKGQAKNYRKTLCFCTPCRAARRSVLKIVAKALGNPLHFDRQFWIHLIPTKRLELCNEGRGDNIVVHS